MRTVSILALCAAAVAAVPAGSTYDSKYDNFDIESLVGNIRLLRSYGNCFLDKGPCSREGSDFKRVIQESLQTKCGKCTPAQRDHVRKAVRGFQKNLPETWNELVQKYDSRGEYREGFQQFLESSD